MKPVKNMRIASEDQRPLARRMVLTMANLTRLQCGGRRQWVYDTKQPGLAVMLTPSGSKTFYLYRWFQNRPVRIRLGAFPDIAVDHARKLAHQALADMAAGHNPQEAKKKARAKHLKLADLWKWYDEAVVKRKRSADADRSRYEHHLKAWEKHRLDEITRQDVAALHQRIARLASEATANRVLALLSNMFSRAHLIGYTGENPVKGVTRFHEQSRERFASPDEMQRLLEAMDEEPGQDWKDFFRLCLYTGARRGNLLSARWDEIDMAGARWTIPGAKFKNKRSQTLYLPASAVEILSARKRANNDSEWVFPAQTAEGHRADPRPAWERILKRAKITGLRIHDLRRSLGSWMTAAGASLSVIGKQLGHRHMATTAIYSRLDVSGVQSAVDTAVAAMEKTREGVKEATSDNAR